jgi:hypothetical protein
MSGRYYIFFTLDYIFYTLRTAMVREMPVPTKETSEEYKIQRRFPLPQNKKKLHFQEPFSLPIIACLFLFLDLARGRRLRICASGGQTEFREYHRLKKYPDNNDGNKGQKVIHPIFPSFQPLLLS